MFGFIPTWVARFIVFAFSVIFVIFGTGMLLLIAQQERDGYEDPRAERIRNIAFGMYAIAAVLAVIGAVA